MKTLSRWGARHPKTTRWIIAIAHLLVFFNAVFAGVLLYFYDWGIFRWSLMMATTLFFIFYLFYPDKKKRAAYRNFYVRQKIHDFSVVFCYAAVITLGVNNFLVRNDIANTPRQPAAQFIVLDAKPDSKVAKQLRLKSFVKTTFKKGKKALRKQMRNLKKEFKQQNRSTSSAGKAGLVILVILVALALFYLIAVLSCNLSCSGQEGLAGVVLIGGLIAIIFGMVVAFKAIKRMD